MVRGMFAGAPITPRTHAMVGQVIRVQEWLGSLAKLDDARDYQAVLCGERSLFEATLDIVLLASDPTAAERMIEWEESAKLKQAKLAMEYVARMGGPVDDNHGWAVRVRMEEDIKRKRQSRGWEKHPERWTGPRRTLGQDAVAGDRLQQRFGFEHWYETRYRFVCWTVHGSGLVLRMVDPVDRPAFVARSLNFSADLAQEAARSTVEGMGWSGPLSASLNLMLACATSNFFFASSRGKRGHVSTKAI
jgi:hypothetical protein